MTLPLKNLNPLNQRMLCAVPSLVESCPVAKASFDQVVKCCQRFCSSSHSVLKGRVNLIKCLCSMKLIQFNRTCAVIVCFGKGFGDTVKVKSYYDYL